MKKNIFIIYTVFIFVIISTSGCVDFITTSNSTTYSSHATKVSYTICYGYFVNCSGESGYEVIYDCDLPEVLSGAVSYDILNTSYGHSLEKNIENMMIRWNIAGSGFKNYELGIRANVQAQSYIVYDLNGEDAYTITEIQQFKPELVDKYCSAQVDDGIVYVNPENHIIKQIAESVQLQSGSNNSFILVKNLFIWLKENTRYQVHISDHNVQSSDTTCNKRTGDCDDLSILYISLCRALNIPARFIRGMLIEFKDYSVSAVPHAWVEVFVGGSLGNGGWIPVECAGMATGSDKIETEVYQNFGMESIEHLRLFRGTGSNESLNVSMSGPSFVYYDNDVFIQVEAFLKITDYLILESNELYIDENYQRRYK
jgi:hypothetical protein